MGDLDRISQGARASRKQIAVAESLTCGRLSSTIGAGEDASEWFRGGVVAYQTEIKERVLGVGEGVDPCSGACARQLAMGALDLLQADIALSITGVGGPEREGGHEPGTVYVGWTTATGTGARHFHFEGGPSEVIDASIEAALGILVELVG
jgi:nicotinamide-nucleotide amidase